MFMSENEEEDINQVYFQAALYSRALHGHWRRRSVTGRGREDQKSLSRRQRSRCQPSSSANSQVVSSMSEFPLSSTVWLVNCALVPEGPISRVNYLRDTTARGPIPRHPMSCPAICHYLHPRHLLIISSSNFFPEFLPQSHQLFPGITIRKSFENWIIENHLHCAMNSTMILMQTLVLSEWNASSATLFSQIIVSD